MTSVAPRNECLDRKYRAMRQRRFAQTNADIRPRLTPHSRLATFGASLSHFPLTRWARDCSSSRRLRANLLPRGEGGLNSSKSRMRRELELTLEFVKAKGFSPSAHVSE